MICMRVVRAKSGAEAAAVQTLRECGGAWWTRQRLECACLSTALARAEADGGLYAYGAGESGAEATAVQTLRECDAVAHPYGRRQRPRSRWINKPASRRICLVAP